MIYETITLEVPREDHEDPVAQWDWSDLVGNVEPVRVLTQPDMLTAIDD